MRVFGLLAGVLVLSAGRAWAHHDAVVDNVTHEALAAIVGFILGAGGVLAWRKASASGVWKIVYPAAALGLCGLAILAITWFHHGESW